jgi:hypothetical protein
LAAWLLLGSSAMAQTAPISPDVQQALVSRDFQVLLQDVGQLFQAVKSGNERLVKSEAAIKWWKDCVSHPICASWVMKK